MQATEPKDTFEMNGPGSPLDRWRDCPNHLDLLASETCYQLVDIRGRAFSSKVANVFMFLTADDPNIDVRAAARF